MSGQICMKALRKQPKKKVSLNLQPNLEHMVITIAGGGSTFTAGIVKSIALRREELEVDDLISLSGKYSTFYCIIMLYAYKKTVSLLLLLKFV